MTPGHTAALAVVVQVDEIGRIQRAQPAVIAHMDEIDPAPSPAAC